MATAMFVDKGNLQHPTGFIPKRYISMDKLFYQIALLYIQQTMSSSNISYLYYIKDHEY
jgi:hypothetical protein